MKPQCSGYAGWESENQQRELIVAARQIALCEIDLFRGCVLPRRLIGLAVSSLISGSFSKIRSATKERASTLKPSGGEGAVIGFS